MHKKIVNVVNFVINSRVLVILPHLPNFVLVVPIIRVYVVKCVIILDAYVLILVSVIIVKLIHVNVVKPVLDILVFVFVVIVV